MVFLTQKASMWIELSPDLENIDFAADNDALAALENILSSVFRGEHVLVGNRKTLESFQKAALSGHSKAVLRSVINRLPELLSLSELQVFKVTLRAELDITQQPEKNHWHVPLRHFSNVALVPASVLCENLRDASALLGCATHFHIEFNPRGLRISLTEDGGGGAEIAPTLEKKMRDARQFVMALTDTDRSHPDAAACLPTQKCEAIADKGSWVAAHVPLPCREIENILPINLLSDSTQASDARFATSDQLQYLQKNVFENSTIHLWADLKLGTKLSLCCESNVDQTERDFWRKASERIPHPFKAGKDCAIGKCPKIQGQKDCECLLAPGLGEKMLERFLEHTQTISMHKQVERIRTSSNSELWFELGKKVANWGIALEKLRA
ncbi:hypothetical protein [Polaromonas sp. UC242_47]|uniref:hypothetical protein n=1 Tax=Polaromonas sp. UC242_47 TaxID=3374626 RepID=UPI00379E6029